ncbi:MAG: hypothetical protein KDK39_07950 [Leptospiraceae bacterium]|nr:hypothetical protein [Leptospiraceae bacterium]
MVWITGARNQISSLGAWHWQSLLPGSICFLTPRRPGNQIGHLECLRDGLAVWSNDAPLFVQSFAIQSLTELPTLLPRLKPASTAAMEARWFCVQVPEREVSRHHYPFRPWTPLRAQSVPGLLENPVRQSAALLNALPNALLSEIRSTGITEIKGHRIPNRVLKQLPTGHLLAYAAGFVLGRNGLALLAWFWSDLLANLASLDRVKELHLAVRLVLTDRFSMHRPANWSLVMSYLQVPWLKWSKANLQSMLSSSGTIVILLDA